MKVAGYVRKSTDDEEKQVYTVEAQEKAIADVCASKAWTLVLPFYSDTGISGTIFNRPGLNQMRKDAKQAVRPFDLVLMVNFDRIARDNADGSFVRKELASYGVKVAETSAPDMDSGGTTGKLVYGIKGVVAEFEHDMISERTGRAMKYASGTGKHMGRPPQGYLIHNCPPGQSCERDGKTEPKEETLKVIEALKSDPFLSAKEVNEYLLLSDYKKAYRLLASIKRQIQNA